MFSYCGFRLGIPALYAGKEEWRSKSHSKVLTNQFKKNSENIVHQKVK